MSIPDDTVPWVDILTFRSEAVSQQQQRALRLWIADVANGKLRFGEASDKIGYLKDEYRAHMKGAGIKIGSATLKTYVVAAAELLESALKLKLKNLAELPFRLIELKANLMEAERKAPGRELAYVVRAEKMLSLPRCFTWVATSAPCLTVARCHLCIPVGMIAPRGWMRSRSRPSRSASCASDGLLCVRGIHHCVPLHLLP